MALGAWLLLFGSGGGITVQPPICVHADVGPAVAVRNRTRLAVDVAISSGAAVDAAGIARFAVRVSGDEEAC